VIEYTNSIQKSQALRHIFILFKIKSEISNMFLFVLSRLLYSIEFFDAGEEQSCRLSLVSENLLP